MRKYTKLDLLRFHRFVTENPNNRPYDLLPKYDEAYPEKSEKEQWENVKRWLRGDIDFEDEYMNKQ